jgi:hypothetical protein
LKLLLFSQSRKTLGLCWAGEKGSSSSFIE